MITNSIDQLTQHQQNTLIQHTAKKGDIYALKFLHEDLKYMGNYRAMLWAVSGGNLEIVSYLYTKGYGLKTEMAKEAAKHGHHEVLHFIYDKEPECIKSSVLVTAIRHKNMGCAHMLFLRNCPVGNDVAYEAAEHGHIDILHLLYARCISMNESVMRVAIEKGYYNIVTFLFDHGFPVPANVMEIAVTYNRKDVLILFQSFGYTLSPNLCLYAAQHNNLDMLIHLYKCHVTHEETPKYAVTYKNFACLKFCKEINLPITEDLLTIAERNCDYVCKIYIENLIH
jgi:hypothetical protein